jgi:hypothetical protein
MSPQLLHHNHILSLRTYVGIFINGGFPEKTRAGLTTELASSLTQKKIINQLAKVNKQAVRGYKPNSCKGTIFPTVKPSFSSVNKISYLTANLLPHITLLTYQPITLLTLYQLNTIFTPSISKQ